MSHVERRQVVSCSRPGRESPRNANPVGRWAPPLWRVFRVCFGLVVHLQARALFVPVSGQTNFGFFREWRSSRRLKKVGFSLRDRLNNLIGPCAATLGFPVPASGFGAMPLKYSWNVSGKTTAGAAFARRLKQPYVVDVGGISVGGVQFGERVRFADVPFERTRRRVYDRREDCNAGRGSDGQVKLMLGSIYSPGRSVQ